MLKKILIGLVGLIVVLAGVSFVLPRTVGAERSIVVAVPQDMAFAYLSDFRNFNEWSPWYELDPDAKYAVEGTPGTVGSRFVWSSEKSDVGSGSQEIVALDANSLVTVELDFADQGTARSTYRLTQAGGGTQIAWGFSTDTGYNPIMRYMGLVIPGMVGDEYERGLAKLKTVLEARAAQTIDEPAQEAAAPPAGPVAAAAVQALSEEAGSIAIVSVASRPILYVATRAPAADRGAIADALGEAYGKIMAVIEDAGGEMAGPPLAITHEYDPQGEWVFDAALPLSAPSPEIPTPETGVRLGQTPSGRAVRIVHVGSYDTMAATYERLFAYMKEHNLPEGPVSWEEYVSDPGETAPDQVVTNVYHLLGE